MRKQYMHGFERVAVMTAFLAASGCTTPAPSPNYLYQIAARGLQDNSREDSARFLDAISITDRVAQAYDLSPDACPPNPEVPDCRTYKGAAETEACSANCGAKSIQFTILMDPRLGSFILTIDHGEGAEQNADAKDLESELVTRLGKQFGEVRKVEVAEAKRVMSQP